MRITIKGKHETLCDSCANVHRRVSDKGDVVRFCGAVMYAGTIIKWPVVECSEYSCLYTSIAPQRMRDIAYVLDSRLIKLGKPGFQPPKQREVPVESDDSGD